MSLHVHSRVLRIGAAVAFIRAEEAWSDEVFLTEVYEYICIGSTFGQVLHRFDSASIMDGALIVSGSRENCS